METSTQSFTPAALFASDYPVKTEVETIASGAGALAVGTVLGRITASGKLVVSESGASDGSQTPVGLLAVPVDASAADVTAPVYKSGDFFASALTLGTGHTVASVRLALDGTPLFITD
jgi:hypothetical protein